MTCRMCQALRYLWLGVSVLYLRQGSVSYNGFGYVGLHFLAEEL